MLSHPLGEKLFLISNLNLPSVIFLLLLKGACKKDGGRVFTKAGGDRTRGNGLTLIERFRFV